VGLVVVLLLAALARIGWLVRERQAVRDQVVQDIARSSSFAQQLVGPLVVVPYRHTITTTDTDERSGRVTSSHRVEDSQLYFLPEKFNLNGQLTTEIRERGIYQARLYSANNLITGYVELAANFGISTDLANYQFGEPFMAVGLSDIRGIGNGLGLKVNDQTVANRLNFSLQLGIKGTGEFHVTPVGRESDIQLSSDWPHPSFTGDYLPNKPSISNSGFKAHWQTTFFATNLEEAVQACAKREQCTEFNARRLGVSLVDPVDQYLKSDRAVKYALLFIALTFASFFLFEVLKSLSVHAVQYALVGAALALFYLLLLSLSEHLGFALAYAISSGACVLLISYYVVGILGSARRALGFGAALAALYALLYTLLNAEDYALLMGALLLFAALAAIMLLTRRVNWQQLTRESKSKPGI
jgi:inner membrane protein